jgi:hypothetical protein
VSADCAVNPESSKRFFAHILFIIKEKEKEKRIGDVLKGER